MFDEKDLEQIKGLIDQNNESLRTEFGEMVTGTMNRYTKKISTRMESMLEDSLNPLSEQLAPLQEITELLKPKDQGATTEPQAELQEQPSQDTEADHPLTAQFKAMQQEMQTLQDQLKTSAENQTKLAKLAQEQQAQAEKERGMRLLSEASTSFATGSSDQLHDPAAFISVARQYGVPIELATKEVHTPQGTTQKAEWVYTSTDDLGEKVQTPLTAALPQVLKTNPNLQFMVKSRSGGGTNTSPSTPQPAATEPQEPTEITTESLFGTAKDSQDPIAAMIASVNSQAS